jgi:hypothetical protein
MFDIIRLTALEVCTNTAIVVIKYKLFQFQWKNQTNISIIKV